MKHNPVCVKCNIGMVRVESGVSVITMFNSPPEPYQIWSSDIHQCPSCGTTVTSGYGENPLASHYEDDFDAVLKSALRGVHIREYESMKSRDQHFVMRNAARLTDKPNNIPLALKQLETVKSAMNPGNNLALVECECSKVIVFMSASNGADVSELLHSEDVHCSSCLERLYDTYIAILMSSGQLFNSYMLREDKITAEGLEISKIIHGAYFEDFNGTG